VKFHATGAREQLGFVAEVVTMPISVVAADRDVKHNISFSVFEVNIDFWPRRSLFWEVTGISLLKQTV
jgi:hypothetical protein